MRTNEQHLVTPAQALTMLGVGVFIIFFGLMALGVNARIVLAVDGVIMCLMACIFGISYDQLQQGIKDTISSMLITMLILLAVGVLISSWMAAGTIPVMIYYGMQVITPELFLPIACLLCTVMSSLAGTSWGTLATVGVACMGVAEGLGVPLEAAAGAVCVGAFFGDKLSPLSDSTVITATVTGTSLMDGIRHASITTGLAYVISLIFFFIYGLNFNIGTVETGSYAEILNTIEQYFNLNPITLLPVPIVIALIVMHKPTIPTFVAGIAVAAMLALTLQGVDLKSMMSTISLLMAAAMFGAPLRTAGVAQVLLDLLKRYARTSRSMRFFVMCLHAAFFTITGAYYVSYPVIGAMTKDMYPEYGLHRKNLMRQMLDTGTGLAPLIPWSTTGSYTASTLGVANIAFLPFAPMLWLSIVFSVIMALTGIGTARIQRETTTAQSSTLNPA